jgi:hypothetical protein
MVATTATDASGVEYYFDETSGNSGATDSGWQDSNTYEDTGLSASTTYTYQVKTRDKSTNHNETAYSTSRSATTQALGYGMTITSCTMSNTSPTPGEAVTLSSTGGQVHGASSNDRIKVVMGFRDASGNWAGGEPVVVSDTIPGQSWQSWSGVPATISAPSVPGTYHVWVRAVPTLSDETAIQEFKNVTATDDHQRNDEWDTDVTVSHESVVVTITWPPSGYATGSGEVSLRGTVTGTPTSMTWTNASVAGWSGSCAVTKGSWTSGNIGLKEGDNVITVEAVDALGTVGSDTITVSQAMNRVDVFIGNDQAHYALIVSGDEYKKNFNNTLYVGYDNNPYNENERSLIRFDLSPIPAGSTINSASLQLSLATANPSNASSIDVSAYRATREWGETTVSWNNYVYLCEDDGYTTANGATIPVGTAKQLYSWDVKKIVEGWVADSYSNYGFVLISNVEDLGTTNDRQFNNPHLIVNYTPERVAPTIAISQPTFRSQYETYTYSNSIDLGGTASDNSGVTSVTWSNDATGFSGTASGTTAWSISGINLNRGENPITVTAHDAAGNSQSDSMLVSSLLPGEIHGTKWNDRDSDGTWDSGEPGLVGWTIYLDQDRDGVLDTGETSTVTGSDGSYAFTGLAAGTYYVAEVEQSGWVRTYPPSVPQTVALAVGQTMTDVNFGSVVESPVSYFADANLKAAVEAALSVTDPTPSEMLGLTTLSANEKEISDLTGLQYATNLTWLELRRNQISDLSTLSGLTNLRGLYLWFNPISDLSTLSGLTNLGALYLEVNQISNISALSGLTNLEALDLSWNQIGDISALSAFTNLIYLDLRQNPLSAEAYATYIPQIFANNPGIELLYDPPASIGGIKWNDLNGDGIQNNGEAGIEGWTIRLDRGGDGTWDDSTTTGVDGSYAFANLLAGTYIVGEELKSGWTQTHPGGEGKHTLAVAPGQAIGKIDFGNVLPNVVDHDNDGIPSAEEQGPSGNDPGYDGNGDAIPDSQQDNVASLHAVIGGYVTIACSDQFALSNVTAIGNPSPTDRPVGAEMPYGFFNFRVTNLTAGEAIVVVIRVPDGSIVNSYYKYGPTPGNPTPHWYEFNYDGQTGALIDGNVIYLSFVDGLRGDDDLTANGIIVEPGAPVFLDKTPPAPPVILEIADDTGTVGDRITSDKTLVINGTAEAGSTVEMFVGCSSIGTSVTSGSGIWSFDYTGTSLADGTYSLTARATDVGGNTSAASAAVAVKVDTIAPGVTVNHLTTTDSTPQLTGTVDDPNATVEVMILSHTYPATNNGDGTWTLLDNTIDPALQVGTYEVVVKATDVAGNIGTDGTNNELVVVTAAKPIYRFWSGSIGGHFYTISEAERAKLINDPAHWWTYEGIAFCAYAPGQQPAGTVPVHRYWSKALGAHFYTASESERNGMNLNFWTYERIAYYVYAEGQRPASTMPVYRFWSPTFRHHFYTISLTERDNVIAKYSRDWTDEGLVWYTYEA